jgi:hypothetical protein
MDASDLIKSMQRHSCKEGAVHIWGPDADRRAKLLICQAVKGSRLDAYSHPILLLSMRLRLSSLHGAAAPQDLAT